MILRRVAAILAVAVLVALACASLLPTEARVGGGERYSGGGGGESFGGGDGIDAGLVYLLARLIARNPLVGIPILIVVLVVLHRMRGGGMFAASGPVIVHGNPPGVPAPGAGPRARGDPADLAALRADDPNFSEPLFLDLARRVYVLAQACRGHGATEPLRPYVASQASEALFREREGLERVSDAIVGSSRIALCRREGSSFVLEVAFEANVEEVRAGHERRLLCRERWAFRRAAGVLSPGPERMRALSCAGCGSTLEPRPDGTCPNCGGARTGGRTQWEVARIVASDRRTLTPPERPGGGGVEAGTDRPTAVDPGLPAARRRFEARHPDHDWVAFDRFAREAFLALQRAWSSGRWKDARRFASDALFQTIRFDLDRNRAFGWTNRIEEPEVTRVDLARIDVDAYLESITVRIFAHMRDWTEDAEGRVVAGSRDRPTVFSEYWTFLRSAGGAGARTTTSGDARSCPSCGAPVDDEGQALLCPYCGSHLFAGAHDWVVSRIEQDESTVAASLLIE